MKQILSLIIAIMFCNVCMAKDIDITLNSFAEGTDSMAATVAPQQLKEQILKSHALKVDKNNVIVMTGKITLSEKKTLSENYRP